MCSVVGSNHRYKEDKKGDQTEGGAAVCPRDPQFAEWRAAPAGPQHDARPAQIHRKYMHDNRNVLVVEQSETNAKYNEEIGTLSLVLVPTNIYRSCS